MIHWPQPMIHWLQLVSHWLQPMIHWLFQPMIHLLLQPMIHWLQPMVHCYGQAMKYRIFGFPYWRSKDSISDSDWMLQELEHAGYWATDADIDQKDYGAPNARIRWYAGWAAGLVAVGGKVEITHYFHRVLNSMKIGKGNPADFVMMDQAALNCACDRAGLSTFQALGVRESACVKEELMWKSDHHQICLDNGLSWPLNLATAPTYLDFSGLLPREREAALLLDSFWQQAPGDHMEFLDINMKLPWLINPHLMKDGDGAIDPESSPWKSIPPTFTGSGKIMMRARKGALAVLRLLHPLEELHMQGWCADTWNHSRTDIAASFPGGLERRSMAKLELLSNMAGNMFTAWHMGPFICALLATIGRFGTHPDEREFVFFAFIIVITISGRGGFPWGVIR